MTALNEALGEAQEARRREASERDAAQAQLAAATVRFWILSPDVNLHSLLQRTTLCQPGGPPSATLPRRSLPPPRCGCLFLPPDTSLPLISTKE